MGGRRFISRKRINYHFYKKIKFYVTYTFTNGNHVEISVNVVSRAFHYVVQNSL